MNQSEYNPYAPPEASLRDEPPQPAPALAFVKPYIEHALNKALGTSAHTIEGVKVVLEEPETLWVKRVMQKPALLLQLGHVGSPSYAQKLALCQEKLGKGKLAMDEQGYATLRYEGKAIDVQALKPPPASVEKGRECLSAVRLLGKLVGNVSHSLEKLKRTVAVEKFADEMGKFAKQIDSIDYVTPVGAKGKALPPDSSFLTEDPLYMTSITYSRVRILRGFVRVLQKIFGDDYKEKFDAAKLTPEEERVRLDLADLLKEISTNRELLEIALEHAMFHQAQSGLSLAKRAGCAGFSRRD